MDEVWTQPPSQSGRLQQQKEIANEFFDRKAGPDVVATGWAANAVEVDIWVVHVGSFVKRENVNFVTTLAKHAQQQIYGDGCAAFLVERLWRQQENPHAGKKCHSRTAQGKTEGRTDAMARRRHCRFALDGYGVAAFALRVAPSEGWWARQDLNLRPKDYESPALTN